LEDSPYKTKENLIERLQKAQENLSNGNADKNAILSLINLGIAPSSMENYFKDSQYFKGAAPVEEQPVIDSKFKDIGLMGATDKGETKYFDSTGTEVKNKIMPLSFKNKESFDNSGNFFLKGQIYRKSDFDK